MRVSSVRSRQLIGFAVPLQLRCHAATSRRSVCRFGIQRSRHLLRNTFVSDAAILSRLAWLQRAVDLEAAGDAQCLLRRESLIKQLQPVRVEIAHHEFNPPSTEVNVGDFMIVSGQIARKRCQRRPGLPNLLLRCLV